MVEIAPIPHLAYNPYGRDPVDNDTPRIEEVFGAAFRQENPIVAGANYYSQGPFARDKEFSITEAGRDDDLYLDHFGTLSAAQSQDEYDWIRGNIVREQKDRETLAAGGWGGFSAAMIAGSLSPTIMLPAFGAARGVKGTAQAFALAAAGATVDEIALMETQYTRTGEEVAFGIAAGTVLGGILGTAARHITPRERVGVEAGMAHPNEQGAIQYMGDGAKMEARSGRAVKELEGLTPEELAQLRKIDPEGTVGAKQTAGPITPYFAPNKVSAFLVEKLGRLNPVTRGVNQEYSQAARSATLQMGDAGMKTEGNLDFRPHAEGGTIETRVKEYQTFEADFLLELDDAFSRHILGDRVAADELQGSNVARLKAATNLPEGKLSHEDFNKEVFRVAQTGETHVDPTINKAAKSWDKLASRVSEFAAEAHQHRLTINPDAKPLFDPEGNLGPDAEKWVSHVFSPEKISENYEQFIQDLADSAAKNIEGSFRKAHRRFKLKQNKLSQTLGDMEASDTGRTRLREDLKEEMEDLQTNPEYKQFHETDGELKKQEAEITKDKEFYEEEGDLIEELEVIEQQRVDLRAARSDDLLAIEKELNRLRARRGRLTKFDEMEPEKLAAEAQELRRTVIKMEFDFDARWRDKGAEDLDVELGLADFSRYGRETGEELAEKIMGTDNPIAGLEILGGKRGPELARTLNMPLEVKSKYLENDLEKVSRIYIRKIAPDIEMYRAFGSVNAAKVFDDVKIDFRNLRERLGSATSRPKSKAAYNRWIKGGSFEPTDKNTIPWPAAQKEKAIAATIQAQTDLDTDLRVMVKRLRHQRGLPQNPNGVMYRLGRSAMDVNVFRFMGSVVLSSLPDMARPVMRYGVSKTLRHGYGQFAGGLDNLKMKRAEARRLGVALDPVLHNRAQAVFDMWDDYASRKSLPERATGFLANKTGLVAGFDRWTAEMKHVTASITMAELSHAMEAVAKGAATAKQKSFLAEVGFDEVLSNKVWAQMTTGEGGNLVDGVWLPNTESWTDLTAKRAYAAAVNKMVDDIIVTPGLDRPNWVDENVAFKMLAQFKSFTFTSTNRVLLRGAQEPDMALVQGMSMALALGMLSYYTYAVSRGGTTLAEANEFNIDRWADEAIARSGLIGIFQEPWNIAQRIPGLTDKVTFTGEANVSRRAIGLIGQLGGPSVDLAERAANIVLGLNEPTQSTTHNARLMSPYQNVFYFRQLMDQIEDTFNTTLNIPERRGQ